MKKINFSDIMSNVGDRHIEEAANYRPKKMKSLRVIAIAACFAMMLTTLTVWAFTQTMEKSAYDTICDLADTGDGVFSVSKLDQKEIFFDLSQENLNEIFSAFDIILEKNETVELYYDEFVKLTLEKYKADYTLNNGKIIVKTDVNTNALKYVMFASVYLENFPEYVAYVQNEEERMYTNFAAVYDFVVSFDYEKNGYDNATEYYRANRSDTKSLSDKTYMFKAYEIDVYVMKNNHYGDPADNLLSMLNPDATSRQERMSQEYNISDLPPEILEQFKDLLTD